jgi:DNA invertase Pin-like site-specific DNA recombinase
MVSNGGFLAYYRVSTGKQGKSGLGIEAQRQAVATYLNGGNWRIVGEFVEVESGRRSDRPELDKALATARVRQVPLVVAKVRDWGNPTTRRGTPTARRSNILQP